MIFSATTRYALRALAGLPEDGSYCQAESLSKRLDLPGHYLRKVLRCLVRDGLLESIQGLDGGFRLAPQAHRITIGEVVRVLEKEAPASGCVLGLANCEGHNHPCEVHTAWQTIAAFTIRDLQLLERTGANPLRQRKRGN